MLRKRFAVLMVTLILMLSLVNSTMAAPVDYGAENNNQPESPSQVSFTDLPNTHWAYKYIADMVNKKVIGGYPDNKFRPNNTISRAEFATIIIKAADLQAKKVNYSSFSDVKVTDWYSPFIETAKDYLTGYRMANGQYNFKPNAPAVREDITIAIVKLKGYDVARLSNRSIIEAMFKDYEGISESAKDYVSIAVENGLVSGYQDDTFRPQNSITRAEAAALLWRAFMYGDDNKGVGGENGATTGITPPVKQPDGQPTPQPTQEPSPQPSQNENLEKFSVDTLVGGTGQGDVDGPVNKAKLNQVDSMVLDKDNNIFFLDKDKRKVRKFNNSNGSVETFKVIDNQFNWQQKNGVNITQYDSSKLTPNLLVYSNQSNKLYLLASQKNSDYNSHKAIFDISTTVQLSVYANNVRAGYHSFAGFSDTNKILYGTVNPTSAGDSCGTYHCDEYEIFNSNLGGFDEPLMSVAVARGSENNTPVILNPASLIIGNYVYILGGNNIGEMELLKIQIFPRKVETVARFNNYPYDAITIYNGDYYISMKSNIYKIDTAGQLSIFIEGKDLTYNDGSPIDKIEQFTFDSLGNIILYEDSSKSIRRINL